MNKIERELIIATKEKKQGAKEERGDYLIRLMKAANELEEDDFESLSQAAMDWFNDNAELYNNRKDLTDFEVKSKTSSKKKALSKKSEVTEDEDEEESEEEDEDEEESEEEELAEGQKAILYGMKDKVLVEGEVVEVATKFVVVVDEEEEEIKVSKSRIKRFEIVGDEEEEEETSKGPDEGEEIDFEDLDVGQQVFILTTEDEKLQGFEGEVTKLSKSAVYVDDEKILKRKCDTITLLEPSKQEELELDEEEEEGGEVEYEEIDVDYIEAGTDVCLVLKDGEEVNGVVDKVLRSSFKIEGKSVKKDDISESYLNPNAAEESEEEEEIEEEEETEEVDETRETILNEICKFPKMTYEKIDARLSKKSGFKYKKGDLKSIFEEAHNIIDRLVEAGKL